MFGLYDNQRKFIGMLFRVLFLLLCGLPFAAIADEAALVTLALTVEADGKVTSEPRITTLTGRPAKVEQTIGGDGARTPDARLALTLTPTLAGDTVTLAGDLDGWVGDQQTLDTTSSKVAKLGEAVTYAFDLAGRSYVVRVTAARAKPAE